MAQKGVNNKYHILLDGKGYIVKPYSPKAQPDSTFINRYATGDPSLIGQPRVPKWSQDDWSFGQGQEFFEDKRQYLSSFGIDITEFSKLKLARKFEDATLNSDDGAWTKPVRFDGRFWAGKGTKIFSSADQVTWEDAGFTFPATVTDLESFENKLYAATAGTSGDTMYEHAAASASNSWAATTGSGLSTYLRVWDDYLYIAANNLFKSYDGIDFTTIKDFTGTTDVVHIFKKPKVFAQVLYVPSNTGADTGPGKLWHYDQENFFPVYESESPIGDEVEVYDNRLHFTIFGDEFVDFHTWNGSSESLSFFLEQPANHYTNISYAVTDNKLYSILKQDGTPEKYLSVYDSAGFSFQSALPVNDAISWRLGIFDKRIFAFGGNGNVYRRSNSEYDASGELISSYVDVNLLDLQKLLVNFTANHESLPAGTSLTFSYRKDGDTGWTQIATNSTDGTSQTVADFPMAGSSVKATKIQVKITLATSTASNSPVLRDLSLGYILDPSSRRAFTYVIVATKQIILLDGSREARTPEQIVNDIWTSKASGNILELVNKYGTFNMLFSESTPSFNDPHPGERDQESIIECVLYVIQ